MLVHLAGSLRSHEKDLPYLRKIISLIHDHDSTLAHNWVEAAIVRQKNNVRIADWTPFVANAMETLKQADVVIIEATHYSFSQGYQMAAALEHRKPVLVVSRDRLDRKYITGFTDSLLSYGQYATEEELSQLVSSFLKRNTIHVKDLRFNFFITKGIAQYLDRKARETGKNRSEIIRDIIKKRNDTRVNR
jgi:hypothetical protein